MFRYSNTRGLGPGGLPPKTPSSVLPGEGAQCTKQGNCRGNLVCADFGHRAGTCVKPPPVPASVLPGEGQTCTKQGNCRQGLNCYMITEKMGVCMKPPAPPVPPPPTKSGMGSKEILTIIGLIFLGLCFLCGLAKMGMKDAKRKGNCDKACGAFVFLGVTLIAVSSVMKSSN
jgi:hypothetical protein